MYLSKRGMLLIAIISYIAIITVCFGVIWIMNHPDTSTIDSDEDGIMDDVDSFPDDPIEHNDSDDDGVGDNKDKFPFDPAASKDSDDDGYPDLWNNGKTKQDSTSNPPLELDEFPFDPAEWIDTDDDGIGDNTDVFVNDPTESRDDDGDGVGNNADHNPYVDLSFSCSIDNIILERNVDILPWAQVYFKIFVDGIEQITWNNNGNYYYIWRGKERSIAKSFVYDIPETGINNVTEIEIKAFDYDFLKKDDQIDINQDNGLTSIKILVYHHSNTFFPSSSISGNKATIQYSFSVPEEIIPSEDIIKREYQWMFKGSSHTVNCEIPMNKYEWALQSDVNRSPQFLGSEATQLMADFVTIDDAVIVSLANKLFNKAQNLGYNDSETLNYVLRFVQQNIHYWDDNKSKNRVEYWRYPIETLVEKQGDCEDTSILFASLVENMDYESVLLFYVINDDIGHLATGVSGISLSKGFDISYKNKSYYYCETTDMGFDIGVKPNDIPDEPEKIILIS